jgi:hypothetical protein
MLNPEIQEELIKLENLLKSHDKYYDYSDDAKVVRQGEEQWSKISSLSSSLKLAGYTKEVQDIFKKYYDTSEEFFGSWKYKSQINS